MSVKFQFDNTIDNFAVFGNPIKHSRSPEIHSLFAEQFAIKLQYQAVCIEEDEFANAITAFADAGGTGINITVPFKELAYQQCDKLSEQANACRSVNTIFFEGKTIHGDTTDGEGFVNDLTQNHQINFDNKQILIMGAGGSVSPILFSIMKNKPEHITIVNRTVSRAENLVQQFSDYGSIQACGYDELVNAKYDLIINATSASLMGSMPELPDAIIHSNTCCYDLMYSDEPTLFLKWAKEKGAALCVDGLGMLVEQAALGFYIWHGKRPETKSVIKTLRAY